MKLLKTKILMIINGLLTFSGLAMLFLGLIMQMSNGADFGSTGEVITSTNSAVIAILIGTIMMIVFGAIFFDDWAKLKSNHNKKIEIA